MAAAMIDFEAAKGFIEAKRLPYFLPLYGTLCAISWGMYISSVVTRVLTSPSFNHSAGDYDYLWVQQLNYRSKK